MKTWKKRYLCLTIMMILGLTGCSSSESPAPKQDTANETTAAESEASTAETEAAAETMAAETEAPASDYVFPETVLVDNENCKFTVTGFEKEFLLGYTLKAELENKSGATQMFSWEDCEVDGWMIDPGWASEVAPGMKSNESISFTVGLEQAGIETPSQIKFLLHVYDSDNWEKDFVKEQFTVYPQGEEAAQIVQRADQPSDVVLAENDSYRIVKTDAKPDDIWGYALTLYIENKSDKTLLVAAEDVAVNQHMCDPFWAASVNPGAKRISDVTWLNTSLEEQGIENVEDISMKLSVTDYNTFSSVGEEKVSIQP